MRRMRTIVVLAGLAAIGFSFLHLAAPAPVPAIYQEGEDLVYEVSWTMFKLGTIRLKSLPDRKTVAYIDSYAGLPFVDLHSVHYSWMDSLFLSHGSLSLEKRKDRWWGLDYRYDLPNKRVIVEEIYLKDPAAQPDSRTAKDTLALPSSEFVDGLCIGYFPRRFIQADTTVEVPTILYGKLGQTSFRFTGDHSTESIDALDAPVRVVKVEGNTSVEGIFGMTGDFKGWFSDDEAGVPIKGKLTVLLGNVTIELIQWNRKGWNPPQ